MNISYPNAAQSIRILAMFALGSIWSNVHAAGLKAQSAGNYSVVALDTMTSERWPQPATFAIRRTAFAAQETVEFRLTGTALYLADYNTTTPTAVTFSPGQREAWVRITPVVDRIEEPTETVVLTLTKSPGSAVIELGDFRGDATETEATRFLLQAAFGADPQTLAEVRRTRFDRWINQQFERRIGYLQPSIQAKRAAGKNIFHPETKVALWEQVMRPPLAANVGSAGPDPLRQRIAYSLLQIFVISQNQDTLSNNSEGVVHYYDRLLEGAFGNYRDLLRNVCMHPCMGVYLSHVGNRRADPARNRFPDENFAREVMQLFSIGLWQLNPDGTRVLVNGQPVPTYTNETIGEYARVFTGFQYGGPNNTKFDWAKQDFVNPMKLWDTHHDMGPKRLLSGITTPARTTVPSDPSAATRADLEAAVDSLFLHPNVGPFIGRQLIQRLVTSNPSPAYVGRVSAAFADNGRGVRGDMRAVVRAILLDPEARSYSNTLSSSWGKKREPYMVLWNLAKAFDARPASGLYDAATYMYDFMNQEPFQSPSVFNFYLPSYRPSGVMTTLDLAGPEFQIMTAVTGNGALNICHRMIYESLSPWGGVAPENQIRPKIDAFLPLAPDPDALVRQLALRMLDRSLSPRSFQIIREAVAKIPNPSTNWQSERVRMAMYLIVSTPEFQIQK